MDRQKLRSLVFEQTGIRVDTDDPIFALVALNEAVLAGTVERQAALLDAAAARLAQQAYATAGVPAPAPVPAAAALPGGAAIAPAAPPALAGTPRLIGAAAAIAIASAALTLAGQALFFKVPAPGPVGAAALTAEQARAIERGARLERAVQKLDPKSRSQLQQELQQP